MDDLNFPNGIFNGYPPMLDHASSSTSNMDPQLPSYGFDRIFLGEISSEPDSFSFLTEFKEELPSEPGVLSERSRRLNSTSSYTSTETYATSTDTSSSIISENFSYSSYSDQSFFYSHHEYIVPSPKQKANQVLVQNVAQQVPVLSQEKKKSGRGRPRKIVPEHLDDPNKRKSREYHQTYWVQRENKAKAQVTKKYETVFKEIIEKLACAADKAIVERVLHEHDIHL